MLAIIPARGGSKGVPKKNIRLLGGKPLIHWTIQAALGAAVIDRAILSTDDEEIADVCRNTGIEIPFMRPKELAQDHSLAIDNYLYTIDRLNDELDVQIKEFVVLLPTAPFRSSADVDTSVAIFHKKQADSVISCTALQHPLEWVFSLNERGAVKRNRDIHTKKMMNRQASDSYYMPNGGVYVFKTSLLKETQSYYSEETYPHVMSQESSVDIDTEFDFLFAEFLVSRNIHNE